MSSFVKKDVPKLLRVKVCNSIVWAKLCIVFLCLSAGWKGCFGSFQDLEMRFYLITSAQGKSLHKVKSLQRGYTIVSG